VLSYRVSYLMSVTVSLIHTKCWRFSLFVYRSFRNRVSACIFPLLELCPITRPWGGHPQDVLTNYLTVLEPCPITRPWSGHPQDILTNYLTVLEPCLMCRQSFRPEIKSNRKKFAIFRSTGAEIKERPQK
jgi:hypothetical protein